MSTIGLDSNSLNNINPISEIKPIVANTPVVTENNIENSNVIGSDLSNNSGVSSKGGIPSSGICLMEDSKTTFSSCLSNVTQNLQSLSGDKTALANILKDIQNIDFSKGIHNLSQESLIALAQLGLDITSKKGQLSIIDQDGNTVTPQEFLALQSNIENILKRTIAAPPSASSAVSQQTIKEVDDKVVKTFENLAENKIETDKKAKTEAEPLSSEIKEQIKSFELLTEKAKQISAKVDSGISQIKDLKLQANSIIGNAVSRSLTETEKKQLKSIEAAINIKQKELLNNVEGAEFLMQDVDQVFSSFSDKLSESERGTMVAMKDALQAKISGQSLTVRQNFLTGLSEEIYRLTANMSDDQIQEMNSNPEIRVKMLASNNKALDKLLNATKISDFSQNDLSEILNKFKIKVVEENGGIGLYYMGGAQPVKVTKEDLKQMKIDLNNIVTSPELFTLARATGEISMAYTKNQSSLNSSTSQAADMANKKEEDFSDTKKGKALDSNFNINSAKLEDKVPENPNKSVDSNFLQKSMEKRQEEEKYHLRELGKIQERRREINRELEQKRINNK